MLNKFLSYTGDNHSKVEIANTKKKHITFLDLKERLENEEFHLVVHQIRTRVEIEHSSDVYIKFTSCIFANFQSTPVTKNFTIQEGEQKIANLLLVQTVDFGITSDFQGYFKNINLITKERLYEDPLISIICENFQYRSVDHPLYKILEMPIQGYALEEQISREAWNVQFIFQDGQNLDQINLLMAPLKVSLSEGDLAPETATFVKFHRMFRKECENLSTNLKESSFESMAFERALFDIKESQKLKKHDQKLRSFGPLSITKNFHMRSTMKKIAISLFKSPKEV